MNDGATLEELAQRALSHTTGEAQATVVRERSLLARFATRRLERMHARS